MFNSSLKRSALTIHENTVKRYNSSYESLTSACAALHEQRETAIVQIETVEQLVNSIANTPKEFETQMGQIRQELLKFRQTKEYAAEAFKSAAISGVGILSGVAAGGAVAALAPTAAMGIATTFGTASTGAAIATLHGVVQTNAALAWLGGGALAAGGGGMAAGQALLALAGPIGWSIAAAGTGVSLLSLTSKNKKIADQAVEEAKKIEAARGDLDNTTEKVKQISVETRALSDKLTDQIEHSRKYENADYSALAYETQMLLGTLVNNTLALAVLVNRTVE